MMAEQFTLRPVTDDDHPWLVELHNDPLVLNNVTHPSPITLESHLAWWKGLNKNKEIREIFCVNGERAGFAKIYGVDLANRNCVLGADIHSRFRGKGYAKYLWQLMLQKCFDELGMHRVSLTTADYNQIGQRLYGGLGFREEGRLTQSLLRDGKYFDQICMYLLAEEWRRFAKNNP